MRDFAVGIVILLVMAVTLVVINENHRPETKSDIGKALIADSLLVSAAWDSLDAALSEHRALGKKRDQYIDSLEAWLDREIVCERYWRKKATDCLLRSPKVAKVVPAESLSNCMYLIHEHEVWKTGDPFGNERFWQDDSGVVSLDPPWQEWRRVPTP